MGWCEKRLVPAVDLLGTDVHARRAEVNMLNKAVARIDDCHHAEQCPVRESLNKE